MVTALYRRYRPETFAELIGQSQVTEPLMTALRTNRVNHAYLFSGPRGCGKTTSARILARCLNCAQGPTDTPCGVCDSCVELSRDGGGSLDVVEIDAASHNGVDDARDLRERAVFAPARDRYKIFILDEAHMVTPQGFNALLKIVEEPPEHVKFIFATTEPEKVIGTIRSRTHHYPFRLVPPAQMLEYVDQISRSEKIDVEPGVLPLVVRAGGGSVRDTLSLLDQLIAGSEASSVQYERAVALLGYTHAALLGEVVEAIGTRDAAAAFAAVDRVIQTGQDPRRFVEDLLERLRDLIIVAATGGGAAAVLRGVQQDELDRMAKEAALFGVAELSRAADVVNAALTEMTGATSPRLHLELLVARVLLPSSDDTERGTLARLERLERRIGVVPDGVAKPAVEPHATTHAEVRMDAAPAAPAGAVVAPADPPRAAATPTPVAEPPAGPVTLQQVKDAWPEILKVVEDAKRTAWMVLATASPRELRDNNVLVLTFPSQKDVDGLKERSVPGQGIGDYLKQATFQVLGIRPALVAKVDPKPAAGNSTQQDPPDEPEPEDTGGPEPTEPDVQDALPEGTTWYTAPVPESDSSQQAQPAPTSPARAKAEVIPEPAAERQEQTPAVPGPVAPEPAAPEPATTKAALQPRQRYGESVVREILGASFIEEQTIEPVVTPKEF
ncbi:MAG: DNA polymerase III subunit gamma and tau [Terrimesophilobacter sp.]